MGPQRCHYQWGWRRNISVSVAASLSVTVSCVAFRFCRTSESLQFEDEKVKSCVCTFVITFGQQNRNKRSTRWLTSTFLCRFLFYVSLTDVQQDVSKTLNTTNRTVGGAEVGLLPRLVITADWPNRDRKLTVRGSGPSLSSGTVLHRKTFFVVQNICLETSVSVSQLKT